VQTLTGEYGEKFHGIMSMRRLGGIGALVTLLTILILASTGAIPPSMTMPALGILLGLFFFFAGLYIIGTFMRFDKRAYPFILVMIIISLIIFLVALTQGFI
jgi:hypothetical protein